MIANSLKQELYSHSLAVGLVAKELATFAGMPRRVIDASEIGGYLHDVGKAMSAYQDYITGNPDAGEHGDKPLHHEVSWAVSLTELAPAHDSRTWEYALSSVYWHHARPMLNKSMDYYKNAEDIVSAIPMADVKAVLHFALSLSPLLRKINRSDDDLMDISVPDLYSSKYGNHSNVNSEMMAVRACVIAADRVVSTLHPDDLDDLVTTPVIREHHSVAKFFNDSTDTNSYFKVPDGYGSDRFNMQRDCASACVLEDKRTTVVRAPAGFGKTMIGTLCSIISNRRTYWVCPRNAVASSVYDNIIREVKALGFDEKVSVELYLTSQRVEATPNAPADEMTADIIVTNIDNLLKPMVNNGVADRLWWALTSNVILDEFHEFASDGPMFAAFITFMRLRNRVISRNSKSRTVLLSATPGNMHELWDDMDARTTHLPSKSCHYPAAHEKPYSLSMSAPPGPGSNMPGFLTVQNSIRNAQDLYTTMTGGILAHSSYTPNDKSGHLKEVFDNLGKHGDKSRPVSAAPIVQAAMDISARGLFESVCSPESTMQRIGRCNRWGELDTAPVGFVVDTSRRESGACRVMYDHGLRMKWAKHLSDFVSRHPGSSLDFMYTELYGKFYDENGTEVLKWLTSLYSSGIKDLSDEGMAPYKMRDSSDPKDTGRNAKSLRNPDGSYFITVRRVSNGEWLGEDELLSLDYTQASDLVSKDWLGTLTASGRMHLIKSVGSKYPSWGVIGERLSKNKMRDIDRISSIMRMAKSYHTPIPVSMWSYDDVGGLGLVKS